MFAYQNIEKLVYSAETNGAILVTLFHLLYKIPLFHIFNCTFITKIRIDLQNFSCLQTRSC